jgi:prepilin-type N-terminal cleavage/methylation domain-containing protein/prepilin-type processing-associated H-X9-DG protein
MLPFSWRIGRKCGFTLVELLVVIAIIGILIALLLPAVQAARESSRGMHCQNNLKQMGIATLAYHNNKQAFPPGARMHQLQGRKSISWRVLILPYLEETPLSDLISPTSDGGAVNWTPEMQLLSLYICPTEEEQTAPIKLSHYAGVGGAGRNNGLIDLEDDLCGDLFTDGMYFPGSNTRISKVTDGTSHTTAIGEHTYVFFSWMLGATWLGIPHQEICGDSTSNIRYPINASHSQFGYYVSDTHAPASGPFTIVVNDLYFGSKHPGGANFCFADGSVHMLTDTMDFSIYQDLATIAGGEMNRWNQ